MSQINETSESRDQLVANLDAILRDAGGIAGYVQIDVFDLDGNIVHTEGGNTVTTAGKAGIADQILAAPSLNKPTHMAIGTGSPAANALGTESDRNALVTKTRSTNVITMTCTWTPGEVTASITEAGIFDAASVGNAWCTYGPFTAIPLSASLGLTITWTLTIS